MLQMGKLKHRFVQGKEEGSGRVWNRIQMSWLFFSTSLSKMFMLSVNSLETMNVQVLLSIHLTINFCKEPYKYSVLMSLIVGKTIIIVNSPGAWFMNMWELVSFGRGAIVLVFHRTLSNISKNAEENYHSSPWILTRRLPEQTLL